MALGLNVDDCINLLLLSCALIRRICESVAYKNRVWVRKYMRTYSFIGLVDVVLSMRCKPAAIIIMDSLNLEQLSD